MASCEVGVHLGNAVTAVIIYLAEEGYGDHCHCGTRLRTPEGCINGY